MIDQVSMVRTHPQHMAPMESPYALNKKATAEGTARSGSFQQAMLKALDGVSGAHQRASMLEQEAILNPDLVDVHDVTIAQAEASMAFNITRTILSRMVQGWRDLINTR